MDRRLFVRTVGMTTMAAALPPGIEGRAADGAPEQTAAANSPFSAPLDERLLHRMFVDAVRRSGAVGAQLSIIKANQQVDFAAGFAHAQRRLEMTTDTLMQIGSVTKVFNAMIAVSLSQEGVLDLDTPVERYVPDFRVGDPEASRTLTLRRLLSMSSGLDNGPYVYFGGGDDALVKYVVNLRSLPQQFQPGKYFGYSNAGICIAGHVASRVTGKPWEALLRERILQPAGLTQSAALESDVLYQSVSAGHRLPADGGRPEIVDPVFTMHRSRAPSGACFALSTGHLARFGKIFVRKGVADTGARILSVSSVEQMMAPQIKVPTRKFGSAWCIGPYLCEWQGVQLWGHVGGTPTTASYLHWIPQREGVIAFIVNTPAAMGEFSRIVFDEIMSAAFGVRKPRIDEPQIQHAAVNHDRYVGRYEELGATMNVVRGEGNTLRAMLIPRWKIYGVEQTATLTPLGEDRFLLNPVNGPDKQRGVIDTAFFGDDGAGRATNVLNYLSAMRRA